MRIDPAISVRLEFARSAAFRREQERHLKETEKKQKEVRAADRVEDELSDLIITTVVQATEKNIALYFAEAELYRTATTEALMENERQLTEVQRRLDYMLARAYILPDGRRVFKSRDGQHAYDEHGLELGRDEIDPDLIEDWRPLSDDYLVDRGAKLELLSQRRELLTYEERMRIADERVEAGDITQAELDELKELRRATAPKEVLERLRGLEQHRSPEATRENNAAAQAENLDLDLRDPPVAFKHFGPAPGLGG